MPSIIADGINEKGLTAHMLTQAIAYMEEAVASILVPTFDEKKNPISPKSDAWEARCHMVYDLKNMNIYFNQDETGKKIYLKIKDIDFTTKTIQYIDPDNLKSVYGLRSN